MGMFRQCEMGWSHAQFGNFCQMLLTNSTNPHLEYFCTFQRTEIPSDRLPQIASALESLTTHPDFIEDGQVPTMVALIEHMRMLAAEGLPLEYR